MCSHKYSDPQHSVSQQDCMSLTCSVYNSLPSLVLKRVSTRAGTLPLCPLTLSSPSTLTKKSVNASSVVYVYEVTLAGTSIRIGSSCLFRRRKSALLIKTSYPAMKAGSTSGTFQEIVKPNPSVTLVAAAGVLAESGMASGSGYNSEMVQERSQEKCYCSERVQSTHRPVIYIHYVHVHACTTHMLICSLPPGLGIYTEYTQSRHIVYIQYMHNIMYMHV